MEPKSGEAWDITESLAGATRQAAGPAAGRCLPRRIVTQ